jgi:hypothetical protein
MTMKTRKKYTLSQPRTRSENIAAFRAIVAADAPPTPPVKKKQIPCPDCDGNDPNCATCGGDGTVDAPTDSTVDDAAKTPVMPPAKPAAPDAPDPAAPVDDADGNVDAAIADLDKAVAAAQAAQATDTDGDPNDKTVSDTLDQIAALMKTLDAAQKADDADEKTDGQGDASDVKAPIPPDTKLSIENVTPKIQPVDDEGNVDPSAVCATEGCNHLASAHENMSGGDNSGSCSMCSCSGFLAAVGTPSDPEGDDADGSGDGGGVNNNGGDDSAPHAVMPVDSAMPPAMTGPALAPADSNPAPTIAPSLTQGVAFRIPVMVIEGQSTGDGRGIALNALTWGNLPMPLMGMATATHDPMGMDQNDPSIMCGRIDTIDKSAGENDTQIVFAEGFFLDNDDGNYFADLVSQMGRVGVSADISVDESQETMTGEMDDQGWPTFEQTLIAGVIQGCTVVPFPAFTGAYITTAIAGDADPIPQQVGDEMPMPDVVASGGFLIHYMVESECAPCNSGYELVASGAPVHPPSAWFANPMFCEGDARLKEIFVGRGDQRVGGAYACPPTITDDGRVFGHIAAWGVCHTGMPGSCVTPPHTKSDYAHFMRDGQRVKTAEGDEITVGVLTFHGSHAATGRHVGASSAMAHYDNTATAFADVCMYEDEFGIAYAGALRPDVTPEQLREIRAASPSGDWREIGGNLELVAVLQVNQPGFPLATVANGRQVSLVAAGAYQIRELLDEAEEIVEQAYVDTALRTAMQPFIASQKNEARKIRLNAQKQVARRRVELARKKS